MQMPIRSLQSMLRLLQRHAGKPTTVVPDGIFGPETARAVREFQQQNGLPVTGAADLACNCILYLIKIIPCNVNIKFL